MTDIEKKAYEVYPEDFAWCKVDNDNPDYTEIDDEGQKWLRVDANKFAREIYIKALTEIESLPKIRGWVARDKELEGGKITLFYNKPYRKEYKSTDYVNFVWLPCWGGYIRLPKSMFPDITWESEPVEVELLIRSI